MRKLLVLALLAACSKSNPYYCEGNPDNNCMLDADINAPMGCETTDDCKHAAKPICEPVQKLCVACTDDLVGACGATTPVCSAANTCAPCSSHGQCDSNACLPTGGCGDDTNVVYVAATGVDDAGCGTRAAPCQKITTAATKGKPYIKVQTDLDEAVVLDNANATILAEPGAAVRRSTTGAVFDIRGASTVTIRDLTIREGLGSTGHGVLVGVGEPVNLTLDHVYIVANTGKGLVMQGGTLALSRSVIAANVAGGALLATTFNITNSLFVSNGSAGSDTGGLSVTPSGTVTFKFNTIANNTSANAVRGINCASAMTIESTIISANEASASCSFEYSLFDASTNVGGTNRAGDPKFKNVLPANPLAADYFRIGATSDAVDRADPASTMVTDIDGEARPQGNAPDIGADESELY